MGQGVAQLAALVDRARSLGRKVTGDAAGIGELAEELLQAGLVIGDIGANLTIGTIEQGLGSACRATVTRAHKEHGVLLVIGNKTVYMTKQKVHARSGAPVTHQAVLDVGTAKVADLARLLIDKILAHQGIGAQVDLTDGEIVGAAPVLLHPLELLAGNGCIELFPRRSDNGLSHVLPPVFSPVDAGA